MPNPDDLVKLSATIRYSQSEKMNTYLKHNKDLDISKLTRLVIDYFFKRDAKTFTRDFLIYIGYPFIVLLLVVLYSYAIENIYLFWLGGGFISVFFYSLICFTKKYRGHHG